MLTVGVDQQDGLQGRAARQRRADSLAQRSALPPPFGKSYDVRSVLTGDPLELGCDARIRPVVDDRQATDVANDLGEQRGVRDVSVGGHHRPDVLRDDRHGRRRIPPLPRERGLEKQ
jgi:hypothetical protein